MSKNFFPLDQNGPIVVPVIGSKMTLINAGSSAIFITDADTDTALSVLDDSVQRAVKGALYSIEPGKVLRLLAGTYNLDLGNSLQANAVLVVEVTEPKKPAAPVPPVVPPAETVPPAGTGDNQNPT